MREGLVTADCGWEAVFFLPEGFAKALQGVSAKLADASFSYAKDFRYLADLAALEVEHTEDALLTLGEAVEVFQDYAAALGALKRFVARSLTIIRKGVMPHEVAVFTTADGLIKRDESGSICEAAEFAELFARNAHFLGDLAICRNAAQLQLKSLGGVAQVAGLGSATAGKAVAAAELIKYGSTDAEHGIGLKSLLLLVIIAAECADEP